MNLDITGKRALITGSTRGIGLASAVELASMGADIVINGRSQDKVDEAIDVVTSKVPNATIQGVAADLGTAGGCKVMIAAVPDVDILVNNMGIYDPKAFENISDDNSVLPGPTSVELQTARLTARAQDQRTTVEALVQKTFSERRPSSLIKRYATPEEVANLIAYVCSPASAATNGAALRVDGGIVRNPF